MRLYTRLLPGVVHGPGFDRAGGQSVPSEPARGAARWPVLFSRDLSCALAGIPFAVEGLERLPQVPCVVVANHASYIDGIVAAAALPPDFAFVIKKEMVRVPLAGLLLRRLGSQFVERFDRHKGGVRCAPRAEARGHRPVPGVLSRKAPSTRPAKSANSSAAHLPPRRAPRCPWWPWPFTARGPFCRREALPSTAGRFASKYSTC